MDFSIFAWWGLKWEECWGGGDVGAEVKSPPQGLSLGPEQLVGTPIRDSPLVR